MPPNQFTPCTFPMHLLWVSYTFPMVPLCFSYGFLTVSYGFPIMGFPYHMTRAKVCEVIYSKSVCVPEGNPLRGNVDGDSRASSKTLFPIGFSNGSAWCPLRSPCSHCVLQLNSQIPCSSRNRSISNGFRGLA